MTGDAGLAASAAAGTIPGAPAPPAVPTRSATAGPLPAVAASWLAAQVLPPGGTIKGQLPANSVAVYSMQVAASSTAYFKGTPDCKGATSLRWQVETPTGSKILGFQSVCSDIGRVVFPAGGPYRLRVFSYDRQPGDYRLSWLVSRPDEHRTLHVGRSAARRSTIFAGAVNCTDLGPVVFPSGDQYALRVFGSDDSTGAYEIRWQPSR
jgi:hypothetical protein